jgi:hypothetical protein
MAVFVHEIDAQAVVPLLDPAKAESQGNRAMGVNCRKLPHPKTVKGAQDVKFAARFSSGVAQGHNFGFHGSFPISRLV